MNIGKIVRDGTKCRVSKEAVSEIEAYVADWLDTMCNQMDIKVLSEKRKTITWEDVIVCAQRI